MCEKSFLTRSEAADYLGIATQTLANHRRTGPAYHKVFGSIRYAKADLDAWVKQQRVTPIRSLESDSNVLKLRSPSRSKAA